MSQVRNWWVVGWVMTQNLVSKSVSSLDSVQIVYIMDILRSFGIEYYAGKVG